MKLEQRMLFLVLTWFAQAGTAAGGRAPHDPLAPLDFLIGTWTGVSAGSAGTDRFQRDLDGHILQRRSQSMVVGADGTTHRVMRTYLTIYPSADYTGFDALYLDNLGHVILYDAVTVVPGRSVQFTSSGSASVPSFRLTYVLQSPSVLHVTFETAPPGQPAVYQAIAEADETRYHGGRRGSVSVPRMPR
jgi:hypothetical protein